MSSEPYFRPNVLALSDSGNAFRLAQAGFGRVLYIKEAQKWAVWNGKSWVFEDGLVNFLAMQTAINIKLEVERLNQDHPSYNEHCEKLLQHAQRSQSAKSIQSMVSLCKSIPYMQASANEFDIEPNILCCINVDIDLRDGKPIQKHHGRRNLQLANTNYEEGATCETWLRFLDRIFDKNEDIIGYCKRLVGYCLTAETSEQSVFFLHGGGSNGKSTFLTAIADLLGTYSKTIATDAIMKRTGEAHPTGVADLAGARMVIAPEIEHGVKLKEGFVKQISGSDTIKGRFMGKDFFEFRPKLKLLMAMNELIEIQGTDDGIWRRIKKLPFEVKIEEKDRDPLLRQKLEAERSGILNWGIEGAMEWYHGGLKTPACIKEGTEEYRGSLDSFGRFLSERCVLSPEHQTESGDLYAAYSAWLYENGERNESQKRMSSKLAGRGINSKQIASTRKQTYLGIGLVVDFEKPEGERLVALYPKPKTQALLYQPESSN